MNILIFVGAGASVELGVPAMRQMALDLLTHMETTSIESSFIASLRNDVEKNQGDLEKIIEDIDRICNADKVLPAFGAPIPKELIEGAQLTRAEIEWFVQHSCERVRADLAATLWAPLLKDLQDIKLTVVTTNYDRGIELAAQRFGLVIDDGFGAFGQQGWAEWTGFKGQTTQLLKLHGSTDWYQVKGTPQVVKLRHPMPLFGGVTLQIEDGGLGALGSALVLPSQEKRKSTPPFPEISHEFYAAARSADIAVFVGTSLRDPDVQSLATECAKRIPTIIVGPSFTPNHPGMPSEAIIVEGLAGEFLISGLPKIITTKKIPEAGSFIASKDKKYTRYSVLKYVNALTNETASDDTKSKAIEFLWNQSISLGAREIEPLISKGAGGVARDALALIEASRDKEALLEMSLSLAQHSEDSSFKQDVELISKTIKPAPPTDTATA